MGQQGQAQERTTVERVVPAISRQRSREEIECKDEESSDEIVDEEMALLDEPQPYVTESVADFLKSERFNTQRVESLLDDVYSETKSLKKVHEATGDGSRDAHANIEPPIERKDAGCSCCLM